MKNKSLPKTGAMVILAVLLAMAACGLDPLYVRVAFIEGVPETGEAGTPLTLTATVRPVFANNKDIVWSVIDAGTTGAGISGNILNASAAGTVAIKAKIANGIAEGRDFTQEFEIVFSDGGTAPTAYTVTFNANGGSDIAPQSVVEGQKALKPDNPVRTGFYFADWYDNARLTDPPYNFDSPVTGNITLYAKWSSITTYVVTFNSNGGNEIQTQTVGEGGTINKPADPFRSGYNFGGWYRESALVNEWNFAADTVTADITLYAKWTAVYTVTFNSNGGNTPASQRVEDGGHAARPDDPVKAGFGFDNWYADSGLTRVYDFNTPVTGNITLYAKWVELISGIDLTVIGPAKNETPDTAAVGNGSVNYTIGPVSWSPVHNSFQGSTRYTAAVTVTANTGSKFTETPTAVINGHSAVIIVRTDASVTISHTFDPTLPKEVEEIVIISQPAKLAYTHGDTLDLTGLSVKLTYDDNTTEIFALADFGDIISERPADGSTLSHTAHDNQPVTVSIGNHHVDTNILTVGKATAVITFPTAAPITYGETLSQSALTGGSSTPSGAFKWEDDTITPDVNNSGFNVEFEPFDTENYDFSSGDWTWDSVTERAVKTILIKVNKADGAPVGVPIVTPDTASLAITVTPLAPPGNGQSVEYAKGTGTATDVPSTGWQDETAFNGLSTDTPYYIFARSKENDNYNAGTASVSAVSITFHTVTFNSNGGSAVTAQNVLSGGNVAKPADPTRPGYTFDGWYKEAVFFSKWNFSADTVGASITLYARWLLSYGLSLTFEEISEQAPTVTIPVIYHSDGTPETTVSVSNPGQYDTIQWSIPAYGVTKTGDSITLNSLDFMVGKHYITLEVKKGGVPYSMTITFEVRP